MKTSFELFINTKSRNEKQKCVVSQAIEITWRSSIVFYDLFVGYNWESDAEDFPKQTAIHHC